MAEYAGVINMMEKNARVIDKYAVIKGSQGVEMLNKVVALGKDSVTPAKITETLSFFGLRGIATDKSSKKISDLVNAVQSKFQKENRCQLTDMVYRELTDSSKFLSIVIGGTLTLIIVALVITYSVKKKQFGELYTFTDLIKDAISWLWKVIKEATTSIWENIGKLLATAIAMGLVMMLIFYLKDKKILTREKTQEWLKSKSLITRTFGFILNKILSNVTKSTDVDLDKNIQKDEERTEKIVKGVSKAVVDYIDTGEKPEITTEATRRKTLNTLEKLLSE
jgi:hypothetical protein